MRIVGNNADTLQLFLVNWAQVRNEDAAELWKHTMHIMQRCLQGFFLLLAVVFIFIQWSDLLHALQYSEWLAVFHAGGPSLCMLVFLLGLSIFMTKMRYLSSGVLAIRSRLDDEQFVPFAAEQPVLLTQEQLSLLPRRIGPLQGKFGKTIFSRFTTISVDEQSMYWKQAGKNHSLMWNDIRGFYCIKYQNNRGHDNTICIIDGFAISFVWYILDSCSATERMAYEQLSCLVVTRTQLPLRDISDAVATLILPDR